jgi:hypothetical protein
VGANDVISIVPSIAGGAVTLESCRSDHHSALQCICT